MFIKLLSKIKNNLFSPLYAKLDIVKDALLEESYHRVKSNILNEMPDNLVKYGHKVYSGGEEDGIIREMMKRIGSESKVFIEIGCGYGKENNTHFMLLNGWNGLWVDGGEKFIQSITSALGGSTFKNLLVKHCFVDADNIKQLFEDTLKHFNAREIDFFSLDIDGNDFFLMKTVLDAGYFPKAICLEYNGKFPYPTDVKVNYEPGFVWQGDDYMGVSLGAWEKLLQQYNYTLICCDATGNNCFWVRNEYANLFTVYTPEQLYQPARYFMVRKRVGHPPTLKFLKQIINGS